MALQRDPFRTHIVCVEPKSATHLQPKFRNGEEPQACIKSNDCLFKRLTSVGPGCLTSKAKKVTIRFLTSSNFRRLFRRTQDGFLFHCLSVSTD